MDRALVIQKVRELGFPYDEFIVVGGACLAVNGLRKAKDVDIMAAPSLFAGLVAKYGVDDEFLLKWHRKRVSIGEVEVYQDLAFTTHLFSDFDGLFARAQIVEGIAFQPLEHLLECKEDLQRQKDVEDRELIRKHLKIQ